MSNLTKPTRTPTKSERASSHYYLYWDYTENEWTQWILYTFRWSHHNHEIFERAGISWKSIGHILVQGVLFDG